MVVVMYNHHHHQIKFTEPGIPKTSGWLNINVQNYLRPDWYRSKRLFSLERPWKCPYTW